MGTPREPTATESSSRAGLPPGQRRRRDFPRFGVPFLSRPPVPDVPELTVTGAVEHELRLPLADVLDALPRVERTADFHCVATWSATGLQWSGVSFRQFWEQLVVPRCRPAGAVAVIARGADGVTAVLDLRDALADDVLLADGLDGRPLGDGHGAPLRLVSPGQYGYKNIKHLVGLEATRTFPRPGRVLGEHPRARVAFEERDPYLDARAYRLIGRALTPPIAWLNRRAARASTRA
ncbi:molybdopterin-dependent oxidoreductase [Pseudonocardia sp. MH-G8]|uniref:molybdopterin-dependent oxidoreductase n=1 Tax=Pseudonocardia sp. MH-G8 TaxID=1854588 RepID=UPI000BA17D9F|nr:molybdopterin-dependent oxidoreductase [Pseudonocardia sp. MH-G8]OZM78198.1 reductase [Pseudonocardia sp. MH-G8]